MSNAGYRKTTESLRNRVGLRLVNNEKDYLKLTSKSGVETQKIFGNYLVELHKIKTASKPAYVGMYILELSKVLMYEFPYDYINNKYGRKSRWLFKDTDSFVYEIETENVHEEFNKNKEIF